MARRLARTIAVLGALLAALWVCTAIVGAGAGARAVAASIAAVSDDATLDDPASMAPAEGAEDATSALAAADDDTSAPEIVPPSGAPGALLRDRGAPAGSGVRAGAVPPLVHLDIPTPPPRA